MKAWRRYTVRDSQSLAAPHEAGVVRQRSSSSLLTVIGFGEFNGFVDVAELSCTLSNGLWERLQ
jgi:hypothetical protein